LTKFGLLTGLSLQCMLTLSGAVSNCRSLGAGDTLMLAICHLILTAGCLIFTLKDVIHEPRGTVVTTVWTGRQVSRPWRQWHQQIRNRKWYSAVAAAILRNGYDVVFPQWMLQFGRNSVAWCRITCTFRANGRNQNQYGGRCFPKTL